MTLTRQSSPASRSSSDASSGQSFGSADVTVKGKRATKRQRDTIDGCLQQAAEDNASRRLMIAIVMCITQESGCGEQDEPSGAHIGPFQQDKGWGSEDERRDPGKATHAFLITGPSSWKKVHGGVKKVEGNLSLAIDAVQHSGVPNGYAPWEDEATQTVGTWLATGGGDGDSTYTKRYEFTRGERGGQTENSWDAMARLVGEIGAYRWANQNVLFAASGDELRAQAASLTIHGDEPWLVTEPAWSWANNRAVTEVTLTVFSDRWWVQPGGTVIMAPRFGILAGRYMVWHVEGDSLTSPVAVVTLRRPTRRKTEPASTTAERQGGAGGLEGICRQVSDNRTAYVYGGGHGPKLESLKPNSHFDCSSSCSYVLHKAGFFHGSVAITSGVFASSYGAKGKGDEFTVWANGEHVWIEGYDDSGKFAWRFDTSQHSGASGPMLTTVKRSDQARFTPRRWPGH